MVPQSRTDNLLVQELNEELLVYDRDSHKAHRLNATSGFVWQHCNGRRTVSQLAALLQKKKEAPVDEDVVLLALHQLEKASLLRPNPRIKEAARHVSRRQLILSAAIALPVITTILVPTPAQAASDTGCCVCKETPKQGMDTQSDQACNQSCGSHGAGSYSWQQGKSWNGTKCV